MLVISFEIFESRERVVSMHSTPGEFRQTRSAGAARGESTSSYGHV